MDDKSEVDRVLYKDKDEKKGFYLVYSMNYNGNVDEFYANTFTVRRDLRSVRDLRAVDVEMLKNMRDKSLDAIFKKTGTRFYF